MGRRPEVEHALTATSGLKSASRPKMTVLYHLSSRTKTVKVPGAHATSSARKLSRLTRRRPEVEHALTATSGLKSASRPKMTVLYHLSSRTKTVKVPGAHATPSARKLSRL